MSPLFLYTGTNVLLLHSSGLGRTGRPRLRQRRDDGVVGSLGVEAAVEEQGVARGPPRVLVAHAPDRDADALGLGEAALGNGGVVVGVAALDVELGDGDLLDPGNGAERLDRAGEVGALPCVEVTLSADAVDGDAGSDPLI